MSWIRIGVSIGLVLLANAVVLGGIALNRADVPQAEITLTEREVPLDYGAFRDDENTGVSLRLAWDETTYGSPGVQWARRWKKLSWFGQEKLEVIGYDCSVPPSHAEAPSYYGKMLPKEVFVVLEYEGEAWETFLQKGEERLACWQNCVHNEESSLKNLEQFREVFTEQQTTASRLMVIDVGADPISLRTRYPDGSQFLILRGLVQLWYITPENTSSDEQFPPYVRGRVKEILIERIHVPREFREELKELYQAKYGNDGSKRKRYQLTEPSYEVSLKFGSRYEPWVTAIRPLKPLKN
jgi:Domain of unknown function (DUF4824)